MSGAVVLVVILAAADADDASTKAMVRVARDALGPTATVVTHEVGELPSDDEAVASTDALHPTAIAEVAWLDASHLHARLHAHVAGAPRWLDRQIGFEAVDAPAERGRTLGFALVSMLPDRAEDAAPTPSRVVSTASAAPPLQARAPAHSRVDGATVVGGPTSSARRVRGDPPARDDALAHTSPGNRALEVAAIGSAGIDGNAGGIGASVGGRLYFGSVAPGLAIRFAGGARAGEVPRAQASSLVIFGALGLAWDVPWRPVSRLGFGVRADALLMRHQLSHLSSDDPAPVRQVQWIGGADALLDLYWTVSPNAGLFLGGGSELAFGTAEIYVANVRKAQVPPLRIVSELGAIAHF